MFLTAGDVSLLLFCELTYITFILYTGDYIIGDNFVKCEPIFTIFALLRRKLNFQQNLCNISLFILTLVSHYRGKF